MNIKGCIFDLDGVICDTAKYHYLAWKRLADALGFEFTESDNERLKGISRMESLDILLEVGNKTLDESVKIELATKKNDWYVEYITHMGTDEILPGVRAFLDELRLRGIKISLGSVSKNASMILDRLEIKEYFDAIIDGTKIEKAKPDPEVFLKGAEELGLKPEECIVFEDAIAGIQSAKNAGMKCIGVGDKTILREADKVISGFENITFEILTSV